MAVGTDKHVCFWSGWCGRGIFILAHCQGRECMCVEGWVGVELFLPSGWCYMYVKPGSVRVLKSCLPSGWRYMYVVVESMSVSESCLPSGWRYMYVVAGILSASELFLPSGWCCRCSLMSEQRSMSSSA